MANPIAMRSSNPALSTDTFRGTGAAVGQDAMTIQGTVNKTALALLILVATASYTWNLGVADPRIPAFTMVGVIGGLIAAMVTVFKKDVGGDDRRRSTPAWKVSPSAASRRSSRRAFPAS